MQAFINAIAPFALFIFAAGVTLRLGRWFIVATTPHRVRGVTMDFEGGPQPIGTVQALKEVLINPITRFYKKANPTWNRGYMFYHIAIVTEVIGYSMAGLILLFHIMMGHAVPDVASHSAESFNYTPANLLAIVFGNGEYLQASFLFGGFANLFISVTWVAVLFAVAGNLHMVYTALLGRNGAIRGGIDAAANDIRIKGRFMWDRMVVRGLIFTIIWTELLARLHVVEGIVFVHALLGLVLMTLLPFTYLFHIIYNFLAVFYAVRRRRARAIA
jgi:hypothetical protein